MSKTILLVHGAWVTTECWSGFRSLFELEGFAVIVPSWPYMEKSIDDLRQKPDPRLASLTIKDLVDHFDGIIRTLPEPPILMGHSFGGLIVQMLLDRGLGAAGVAIDAGPPRGVIPSFTAIQSAAPVLLAWFGWNRILSMSLKSFSNTFANTVPAAERQAVFTKYIVPAPGRIYFQAALGIGNSVDYKNPKRPPLLLVAAAEDRTCTPSMVRAMFKRHSNAPRRTDILKFANRSHWLIAESGWEEVAGAALKWSKAKSLLLNNFYRSE